MITLNGKKFARNDREFTSSLFSPGGTCVGYYRPSRRCVVLMDMHKRRIGIINADGCLAKATKLDNGRYWYSYATPALIGEYASHGQECDEVRAVVREYLHPFV